MLSKRAPGGRQRSPKRAGSQPPIYAALDLGTNNCRLLVAEARGDSFRVIDGYSQIVRLGEGLSQTGRLSDAAINRTIDALRGCQAVIDRHAVRKTRFIATQACRQAENGQHFLDRVRDELGITLKIIPAQEEARLAVLGCHSLIDDTADLALIVDIGGGSTELSWVDATKVREGGLKGILKQAPVLTWASFPLGVVTLSEAFPEHDAPGWYGSVVDHARAEIRKFRKGRKYAEAFAEGRGHLIGTSGTVTSLAGVYLDLPKYSRAEVDGHWLGRSDAQAVTKRLQLMSASERSDHPCIGPQRADLVLTGCAILEAVWDLWPSDRLRVADRGLREGVLLSLIHGSKRKKRRRKPQSKPVQETSNDG